MLRHWGSRSGFRKAGRAPTDRTAEVDSATEGNILDYLTAHCRTGGAILIATHSTAVAARADHVLVIRDGRLHD
jgi:putative ABC transport system ATP-binding protein